MNNDGTYDEYISYDYKFSMISDPAKVDTDGDGIYDNKDAAPLEIGIGGGIVGELTIVSTVGHSFLVYKSYIDHIIDFNSFASVYGYTDYNGYFDEEFAYLHDKNYEIKANKFITIGLSSDDNSYQVVGNALSDWALSELYGCSPITNGGIRCNWELYNYSVNHADNQSSNAAVSKNITLQQLNDLTDYWNNNYYYSLLNHNCTVVAIGSWSIISEEDFASTVFPSVLKQWIQDKINSFEVDLSYVFSNVK